MKKALETISLTLALIMILSLISISYAAMSFLPSNENKAADIWSGETANDFDGGDGSENNPYKIANGEQLARLSYKVSEGISYRDAYFILTNDIMLNDISDFDKWNETPPANVWMPIGGDSVTPFSGHFDGCGRTISGIYVNKNFGPEYGYGMFGQMNCGTITNLTVGKSLIIGYDEVGGIVGGVKTTGSISDESNEGTTYSAKSSDTINSVLIGNCTSYANVTGSSYVGGIAGSTDHYCTIKNCINYGNILAKGYIAGGIVGIGEITSYCTNYGSITCGSEYAGGIVGTGSANHCINYGAVQGTEYIGGISGGLDMWGFSFCTNFGTVSGKNYVAGIVGESSANVFSCRNLGDITATGRICAGIIGESRGIINQLYNAGKITCTGTKGGIAASVSDSATIYIASCYYKLYDGEQESRFGTPLSEAEMKKPESFVGFDFKNCWTFEEDYGDMPIQIELLPKSFGEDSALWDGTASDGFAGGSGTESDPYIIETANELAYLANEVNGGNSFKDRYIKLANDIKMNDVTKKYWRLTANQWTPIGIQSSDKDRCKPFCGSFDGCGHIIEGVSFSSDGDSGIFGYNEGRIVNLIVKDIYGDSYVGMVSVNAGTVEFCRSTGSIVGITSVGGVVASHTGGVINCCTNIGNVCGVEGVGGVISTNLDIDRNTYEYVTARDCINIGTVKGVKDVGGVVGKNVASTVIHCENAGNVIGTSVIGGIVGFSASGSVKECMNSGTVTGNAIYAGGIVGQNGLTISTKVYLSTVEDCISIGTVNGCEAVGGIVGGNDYWSGGKVLHCIGFGTVSGNKAVGGAVGKNGEEGCVEECYYIDSAVSGEGNNLGNRLTAQQMKKKEFLTGLDFESVWMMGKNCPMHRYTPVILGDVNTDFTVNTGDAVALLRITVGLIEPTQKQLDAAEFNFDGHVDTGDAVAILKYCAE